MALNGDTNRVLVTGASGLIGRALLEELIAAKKYQIRGQVRDRLEARSKVGGAVDWAKVELEQADFTRTGDNEMRHLTRGCDVVIHAAGLVHQPDAPYQEYEVVNVRATQQLAEACVANQVKTLIFLSSSAVYGPGPFERIEETAPLQGKTPYAVSKMRSEADLQMMQGIPRVIMLRPSLVFGEGDRGNLLSMIRSIKEQRYKHIGAAATGKSLIYSKDLARAIVLCLEKCPPGPQVFNVANPEPVSIKTLAEEIAKALNMEGKIASVPEFMVKLGAKAAETFMPGKYPTSEQVEKLLTTTTCSVSKLVTTTGFQPTNPLDKALKSEIAWATSNNLL